MLCCISNLLFPGCPLHALHNVLSNAVVDRVRVVRLETISKNKSMCARQHDTYMSENVFEREYSDHNDVMML